MSQVSYGTITITDTTDIESIYMIYKGGETNTDSPSINWTGGEVDWSTDITQAEGNYIWAITVYKKSGITITQQNYQEYFSDPVCLTGSIGRSVRSISTYYCNYGNGQPEENYTGWSNTVPVYDEEKPNYWIKTVIIYVDSTEEIITGAGTIVTLDLGDKVGIAKSLKVALEPIQDLNGYDAPWVGGAGKNKMPITATTQTINGITFTVNNDGTVTANGTATADAVFYLNKTTDPIEIPAGQYCISGITGSTQGSWTTFMIGWGDYALYNPAGRAISLTGAYKSRAYIKVGNGYTVNNMVFKPMIELGSAKTSYAPYSNICPISGRTEVVTQRTGVNVWDEEWESGYYNRANGAKAGNSNTTYFRSKSFIRCSPYTDYYVVLPKVHAPNNTFFSILYYDENKEYISHKMVTTSSVVRSFDTAHYMTFYCEVGTSGAEYQSDISINYPSTDTEYHAYDGNTYTTSLGQTVYGGTLDVVSGELVVEYAKYTVPSDISVTDRISSQNRVYWEFADMMSGTYLDDDMVVCNEMEKTTVSNSAPNPCIAIGVNSKYVYLQGLTHINGVTDLASFRTWLSNNPLEFTYKLATPQTYQLTPQQVQLLLGDNNVWSDGEIEISSFTIAGQDVTIYKDNGLTDALTKSTKAVSDAAEALIKATNALATANSTEIAQQALASKLKYIWVNETPTASYPAGTYAASGRVDETPSIPFNSSDSSTYGFNSLLQHTKLAFRYNAHQLVTIGTGANNDVSGIVINTPIIDTNNHVINTAKGMELTSGSLTFYHSPTINGTTVTSGSKAMELTGSVLNFYKPSTIDSSLTTAATLDSHGLVLSEGGIVAGQALTNNFIYLSTEDYPLRQYTVTTDVAINNTKTYYTYNSETQRYSIVDTPDVSQISNYYEISNPGLTVNRHTPGDATNDSAWRQVIGSKFGVDASGTLYASGAVFDENIQIGSLSGTTLNRISLNGDALTIQNRLGTTIASYGQTVIIGNKDEGQSYIEITNQGISFYGTGQPENPSASINGQYMYIPYTVVLNEMQVGQYTDEITGEERTLWSWKKMGNKNLRLVWLGGDSQ